MPLIQFKTLVWITSWLFNGDITSATNIMRKPINHSELICLILLCHTDKEFKHPSKLRCSRGRVFVSRHPAPAPRSRTRTSTSPSRDPGDSSPPPTIAHRLISQDAPSRFALSLSLSLSHARARALPLPFGKFAATLINQTHGALAHELRLRRIDRD